MSSLTSLVSAGGAIKAGDPDGDDVRALQMALSQAGYRVGIDGQFGPQTAASVRQFQLQHGLKSDGVVGALTAALLDAPNAVLVATAAPQIGIDWPHDDTASLIEFYGKPWEDNTRLGMVTPPFQMWYGKQPIPRFTFHVRGVSAMTAALNAIWDAAGYDENSAVLKHVKNFSGSYNYRPIRGSSRLSCHAFAAAIDFDAEHLPLSQGVPSSEMPQEVVDAFKAQGFFWGGDYRGRKDPMHFQLAHE